MSEPVVIVDLESDPKPDWTKLPRDAWVSVFVGVGQRRKLAALANKLSTLVARSDQILTSGPARNALDFHIASYLGEALAQYQRSHYAVLSKDKGYDPLLEHLRCRGLRGSRIADISRITEVHSIQRTNHARQLWQLLHAKGVAQRPRTRIRLENLVRSQITETLANDKLEKLVDMFFSAKVIALDGKRLTYRF